MTRTSSQLHRPGAWAASILVALALAHAAGCRAAFSDPVEPWDGTRPADEVLLEGMNAHLLTNLVSGRLVVEVDWVEGFAPDAEALAAFEAVLRRDGAAGKTIELRVDDEIERADWDAVPGDFLAHADLLGARLDVDPGGWLVSDVLHLVYAPGEPELLGWTTTLVFERHGAPQPVRTTFVFAESIRREAQLWVTKRKVERSVLIHEAGHVLGLVSHPDHAARGDPGHCTRAGCVMQHHGTRSQLYAAVPALFAGQVRDEYCELCLRDLARAKERWAERAAEGARVAEEIVTRRRIEEARIRACWYAGRERWAEALGELGEARELSGETSPQHDASASGTIELDLLCPAPGR